MEKIVELFERVQRIPYKVMPFNEKTINENLECGDCRHKTYLLKKLLEKENLNPKITFVLFNWKDLPLPHKMLSILKKSGTVWGHKILEVEINKKLLKVDCSWDPKLKKEGFPITENWNGFEDTKQITNGKLEFFPSEKFKNKKPFLDKEEAHLFAKKLNAFLEEIRKS